MVSMVTESTFVYAYYICSGGVLVHAFSVVNLGKYPLIHTSVVYFITYDSLDNVH